MAGRVGKVVLDKLEDQVPQGKMPQITSSIALTVEAREGAVCRDSEVSKVRPGEVEATAARSS
jgi:hypothetical protein